MNVCKRTCPDGKQTDIQPQDVQHIYGSNKRMRVNLLFVFRYKSHTILCTKQHTHAQVLIPENISD